MNAFQFRFAVTFLIFFSVQNTCSITSDSLQGFWSCDSCTIIEIGTKYASFCHTPKTKYFFVTDYRNCEFRDYSIDSLGHSFKNRTAINPHRTPWTNCETYFVAFLGNNVFQHSNGLKCICKSTFKIENDSLFLIKSKMIPPRHIKRTQTRISLSNSQLIIREIYHSKTVNGIKNIFFSRIPDSTDSYLMENVKQQSHFLPFGLPDDFSIKEICNHYER